MHCMKAHLEELSRDERSRAVAVFDAKGVEALVDALGADAIDAIGTAETTIVEATRELSSGVRCRDEARSRAAIRTIATMASLIGAVRVSKVGGELERAVAIADWEAVESRIAILGEAQDEFRACVWDVRESARACCCPV